MRVTSLKYMLYTISLSTPLISSKSGRYLIKTLKRSRKGTQMPSNHEAAQRCSSVIAVLQGY